MKCKSTLLTYVLDAMDAQHILFELLPLVTPEGYPDGQVTEDAQKAAVQRIIQEIDRSYGALEDFRACVSTESDTPSDQKAFKSHVRRIKKEMLNELDCGGYLTGRALDRQILDDKT